VAVKKYISINVVGRGREHEVEAIDCGEWYELGGASAATSGTVLSKFMHYISILVCDTTLA